MDDKTSEQLGQSSDSYFICGSGSTMLCDLLIRTGIAGNPESYFRSQSIPDYTKAWGDTETNTEQWGQFYIDGVLKAGTSPNGCFGLRMMWSKMPDFLQTMNSLHPGASSDKDRLNQAFGVKHYIHLCREDKVAQAVSLVLAIQTGLWHVNADKSVREGNDTPDQALYDQAAIQKELDMLETEAQGWATWFEQQDITPISLSYEALAADPHAALQLILNSIGQTADGPLPEVGTAPTTTELNAQWTERFKTEAATKPN